MQDIVPAQTQAAPPAVRSGAKREVEPRISKRLRKAINLLETGECRTQTAAAERAGLHPVYLSRALRKVEVQAFIARKRAENIALGSLQASYRMPQLVFAESEHVAAKVSERLLEQSGDLRVATGGHSVNVSINNNISPGYVIDLAGGVLIDQPASAARINAPSTTDEG